MNDDRTAATIQQDSEAFTSQWQAGELGQAARREGRPRISPFDGWLLSRAWFRALSRAWEKGWDLEREAAAINKKA